MPKYMRTPGWLCSDWSYRDKDRDESDIKEVTDFIGEVSDSIEIGCPLDAPGNWGGLVRQLYQEQDFFVKGNKIFKKVDPIGDARDGNAGRDVSDGDKDFIREEFAAIIDRPDVQNWINEHRKELADLQINPEDAMNFADNGLDGDRISNFFELMDTTSLNSPFCGMGYQAPRDKYKMVIWERHSTGTLNAIRRRELLATMKSELTDITDEADLNDYLERIRDDYYEDKRLRQQWNGKAFFEDRSIYLTTLRKRNFDEESIRRKLFMCFDAEKKIIPRLNKVVNGKKIYINKREVDQSKRSFDSLWRKKRIEALNELILTTAQWAEIYDLAKHIRKRARRIRGGFKPAVPCQYENIRQMILASDSSSISRLKTEIMTSPSIPQEYKLEFSEMILLWSQRLYQRGVAKK